MVGGLEIVLSLAWLAVLEAALNDIFFRSIGPSAINSNPLSWVTSFLERFTLTLLVVEVM